ncbi:hypothetical protein [Methanoregula boonei]|uniref:hypothetical protein n=1 Tax=Methanoregula boonei TaxID=358766 RepID=UPI00064E7215|nr:hypothetical protein [Methanoregula boonei]
MPVEVEGRLLNTTTIQLDQPLQNGEDQVVVRLKKRSPVPTKMYAPQDFVMEIAEKDLEELY